MLIDTHCHIDLFENPILTAHAYERSRTICVMSTMLPSHYQAALPHLKPFHTILPAIGLHPLRLNESRNEIFLFKEISSSVEFIGEIGLDFSKEGKKTRDIQLHTLEEILPLLHNGKFLTIHSRNAHDEMSLLLDKHLIGPVCFHYFIGGPLAAKELARKGHYFSINHKMLTSKHSAILYSVPKEQVLVESDGPFLTNQPIAKLQQVYKVLGESWNISLNEVDRLLNSNFNNCRTT